jgi:hypothetical protein
MALTDENGGMGTTMLVQPSGIGGGFGGDGFMGGNGWWILILFILLGGWNGGFGGFGGGVDGGLYPWMNNSQNINSGFRDQMLNDNITSIRDGIYGINNQLCSGFAGVTASVTGAQNAIAQQLYGNQIADLERSFAAQTATTSGLTGIQSQLAQCCCENRAATADLKYTVATEACADRAAMNDGVQKIMDKLCALELDGVKGQLAAAQRENIGLQNQLNMAEMRASQTAQNAFIQQGFSNEVDQLYNRLNTCPVPTTPVYGRTPIFTCNNGGCGCGANM